MKSQSSGFASAQRPLVQPPLLATIAEPAIERRVAAPAGDSWSPSVRGRLQRAVGECLSLACVQPFQRSLRCPLCNHCDLPGFLNPAVGTPQGGKSTSFHSQPMRERFLARDSQSNSPRMEGGHTVASRQYSRRRPTGSPWRTKRRPSRRWSHRRNLVPRRGRDMACRPDR